MPIFEAELSDGRVVEIESDHEPTEQEVSSALKNMAPTTSAAGAFGRAAGESVLPSLGAAAGAGILMSQGNPFAHLAPPYSEIGFGLAGAVLGGLGIGKAQKAIAQAALPEQYQKFEEMRQADVAEHPVATAGGELAGALSAFEFAPGQTVRGGYQVGRALLGKTLSKAQRSEAVGAAIQTGLGAAQSALSGDTSLSGMGKEAAIMAMLGHSRWKGLRPSMGATGANRPTSSPESRSERESVMMIDAAASGKKWSIVDGELPGPNKSDVAHTDPDTGNVTVSRKNLHEWLDQDVPKGDEPAAIQNLIDHETIHGDTPDDLAKEFEESLTPFQRWSYRRRYHGPFHEGQKISGVNLGKEAIRFELQLASELGPSEYIAHVQQEARATKFLTVLDKAANVLRRKARTQSQQAILDRVQQNTEAAQKGALDASRITSPESATQREVRTPVGEEAPLRQSGQTPEAQAARLEELRKEKVLLGPDAPMEGEVITDAAVVGPDNKVATGPHHPGILEKLGIEGFEDRESRNTADFGYRTNRRPFVPRELAGKIAEKSGQDLREWDEPIHSDQVASAKEPGKTVSEQAPPAAPTEGAQPRQVPAGSATTPVASATGAPAAEPTISKPSGIVKSDELRSLEREMLSDPNAMLSIEKIARMEELVAEQIEKEKAAGVLPGPQKGPPSAMTRKTPEVTEDNVDSVASSDPSKLRHGVGIEYGITLEPSDVPRLEQKYKESGDAMVKASMAEDDTAMKREFGKMNFFGGALQGVTRGAHSAAAGNYEQWLSKQGAAAMTRKANAPEQPLRPEEALARRIVVAIKDKASREEMDAIVRQKFKEIVALPQDQWEKPLTEFEATWSEKSIDSASREAPPELLQRIAEQRSQATGVPVNVILEAFERGRQLSAKNISEKMGDADRKVVARAVIYALNGPVEPVVQGGQKVNVEKEQTIVYPEPTQSSGTPRSEAAKAIYRYRGEWKNFWKELNENHPEVPEWLARHWYAGGVHDYLNNASGDRIKELLRAARLEDRFLGRETNPLLQPHIPDIDPDPILKDIDLEKKKVKGPEKKTAYLKSVEFQKFIRARGLEVTPKKGLDELNHLRKLKDESMAEMEALGSARPGREGEPLAEQKLMAEDWRKGRARNWKRRMDAITALSDWLVKESEPPARNLSRSRTNLEEIWWNTQEPSGAYSDYGNQGDDPGFLKSALGKGASVMGKTGTTTRGIAVVVDRKTGDTHAVSVYVRDGVPMIYNPSGPPGGKAGDYIRVNPLLSQYHVKAYFLLRDPVHEFHQRWSPNDIRESDRQVESRLAAIKSKGLVPRISLTDAEDIAQARRNPNLKLEEVSGGLVNIVGVKPTNDRAYPKSGDVMYDQAIGNRAKKMENASLKQMRRYQKEIEQDRQEEIERQYGVRFGPEAEPDFGPEPADAAGKKSWLEKKAAYEAEQQEKRAKEASVGEQMEKGREAEGLRAWESSTDPDILEASSQSPETKASLEAWSRGPKAGMIDWGLYRTDPQRLSRGPMTGVEAESIFEMLREHGVSGAPDFKSATKAFDQMLIALRGNRAVAKSLKAENFYLRGRDYAFVTGMDKIVRRKVIPLLFKNRKRFYDYHNIPKDVEFKDMTPTQQSDYLEREKWKLIALGESVREVYETAHEVIKDYPNAERGRKGPAGEVALPKDTSAFRARTLDRYGETARRDLEQAAKSEKLAVSRTYSGKPVPRVLGEAPKPGEPRGYRKLLRGGPPEIREPTMLGEKAKKFALKQSQLAGGKPPAPLIRFPSPIAAKGGKLAELPMGDYLRRTYEAQTGRKVFTPQGPGYQKAGYQNWLARRAFVTDPAKLAMTRKSFGISNAAEDEMAKMGRRRERPEPGEPAYTKEYIIKRGNDLVLSGQMNPIHEMQQAEKTQGHYIGEDSVAVLRYWGHRLQETADTMAANFGDKNPRSQDAMKMADAWQDRIDAVVKPTAARIMHSFQGTDLFGRDGQMSVTFTRRVARRAKARREGKPAEDVELGEDEESLVRELVGAANQATSERKAADTELSKSISKSTDALSPGEAKQVSEIESEMERMQRGVDDILGAPPGTEMQAMAMKREGEPLPPLPAEKADALGNFGMRVMAELSKRNELTDANWEAEMKKQLFEKYKTHQYDPYLPHIRAVSEQIREQFLNNFIGTGKASEDARKIFTRKRPSIEESKAAIGRAMESDPQGKNITPAEAYHVWNYLKQRFFDADPQILDFKEIRTQAAAELGIIDKDTKEITQHYTQLRMFRAMSTNRTMQKLTEKAIKKARDEARIKGQALNWLKNQEYPGWLRTMRLFPRLFFFDKILGHGLVPMITHAPSMMFNRHAWSVYFGHWRNGEWVPGAWQQMYRMTKGTNWVGRHWLGSKEGMTGQAYHDLMVDDLVGHDHYEFWKQAGLQCDPFKYTDDYQIEQLSRLFGEKMIGWTGGRGFDALKTLRFAMAEKWLNSFPEHLRNKESAALIADSVNHATGIIKSRTQEWTNWLMFAPKLELSRWSFLFGDTVKAINYMAHPRTASMEQRAWAKSELMQKAHIFGWYAAALMANQAVLGMYKNDQKINFTDPTKPDFLMFKIAGFKVGVASPLVGVFKLLAQAYHTTRGERTKFERLTSRQRQLSEDVGKYARGKASPLASAAIDFVTQHDYSTRPLPWSSERLTRSQRMHGMTPYSVPEYVLEQVAPIPAEEAIREAWKSQGLSEPMINTLVKSLAIAGTMAATGARVSEDNP